jgi:hypothetical protein
MTDEPKLRLISDRPKGSDFESFSRRAQCPRYRQRGLVPWPPKADRAPIKQSRRPDCLLGSIEIHPLFETRGQLLPFG